MVVLLAAGCVGVYVFAARPPLRLRHIDEAAAPAHDGAELPRVEGAGRVPVLTVDVEEKTPLASRRREGGNAD